MIDSQGLSKLNQDMRLVRVLICFLGFILSGQVRAQSYDWFLGDQKAGTGKFVFGTFTLASNGIISGTGVVYRHNNRPLILRGSEKTKVFTVQYVEDGRQKTESITIRDLRKRTVSTYRGSFLSSGPYQFGAIQR